MKHTFHRVESFSLRGPYELCVRFEDATEQAIDFEPVLAGEIYGPLRDSRVFAQVKLDSEVGTLVWPNGADFDPATLHDWPSHAEAFAELARKWDAVRA